MNSKHPIEAFFKNEYRRANKIILTGIACFALFSCSPQVNLILQKSYPPREDNESVVIYKKPEEIPIASEKIGTLQAACNKMINGCDSASIFSIAEMKIKKAGGNAFLITNYEKPTFWNNSRLSLDGDVLLVSDFSSPPDTAMTFISKYLYAGLGAGPETGLSLFIPKISYYNFQNRKILPTYYGIEGCLNMIERPWMSLDCLYGIKKGIFTLDTSVGVWWYPRNKYETGDETIVTGPYFHTTVNPKIGFKFWKVWLKGGPSIFLYKGYPKNQEKIGLVDMIKIGGTLFNFEVLIKL